MHICLSKVISRVGESKLGFLQHTLRTHPDCTAHNVPATNQIFIRGDLHIMWCNVIPLTLLTATRLLHTRTPPTNSAWIPSRSRTCLKSDRRGSLMNTD